MKTNLGLILGAAILTLLVISALLAPAIAPYPPFRQNLDQDLIAYSSHHPLGTDKLGRDILSRTIYGGRISLLVGASTVVLAPGCKTGEMTAKRWPYFPELAERFDDVAVVGTGDDLRRFDGTAMRFAAHVRSFAGRLTLRATAEVLASAGVVVANDSGLAHVAAAVGTPTVMIFGPTPHATLGRFPPNVAVLRAGLPCEPCWFGGARFRACDRRIDCLRSLGVEEVEREVRARVQRRQEVHA